MQARQARASAILQHNLIKFRQPSHQPFQAAAFSTGAAQPEPKVLVEKHSDSVTEFKLNAPKALNAVDTEMVDLMIEHVKTWNKQPQSAPRVLLMSGMGGKAFCAGGDIVSIYNEHVGKVPDNNIRTKFFAREYLLDYSLSQMSPLQISIWNGFCMGGGVGLTWHSPIRIATDNTVYAMPETAIGFFTDVGGSYFLPRLNKDDISLGLYLGITGQRVKSRDLVKWGIATHFVPQERIPDLYSSLSKNVHSNSESEQILDLVNQHSDLSLAGKPVDHYAEIREIFKPDSSKAIMERLAESDSEFSAQTKKLITKMSPLAISIVFEQIKRGSTMGIKEVFEMEYRISQGFMNHTEFFEGVRALLVDKDRSPKWKHQAVSEVTQEEVDFFFNYPAECNLEIGNEP